MVPYAKPALVQPFKTQARIDELPERRRRFSLTRSGSHELELIYEERHGVGANPYDVEESDVDLFVAIRDGLAARALDCGLHTSLARLVGASKVYFSDHPPSRARV